MAKKKQPRDLNDNEKAFLGIQVLAEILGVEKEFVSKLREMNYYDELGKNGDEVIEDLTYTPAIVWD